MDNQNNNNNNNNNSEDSSNNNNQININLNNENILFNFLNNFQIQNPLVNFIPDNSDNKIKIPKDETNDSFIKKQKNILNDLNNLISNFPIIFNVNNEGLIDYLKLKNIPLNLVCAKMLNYQGAIYCTECGKQDNCIICFECFENSKELHKGHHLVIKTSANGCCDCGNPDAWDKDHFCPKHKGFFDNEEALNNYIEKCFDKNTINKINQFFDDLDILLIPYFLQCEYEKKIKNNQFLFEILDIFLEFIEKISNANYAILQLVSKKLVKAYNFPTYHDCYLMKKDEIVKKCFNNQLHNCQCSFIKIIMSVFTKQNHESLFYLFLNNHELKENLGNFYVILYKTLWENEANTILEFMYQISTSSIMCKSLKNNENILNMFDFIIEEANKMKETENYEKFRKILYHYFLDIKYFMKPFSVQYFLNNLEYYKKIIDLLSILHNFRFYIIADEFIKDGYDSEDFKIEIYINSFTNYMFSILNFDNEKIINEILMYFIEKINNITFLDNYEHSFHISLIRGFGIFLNRYTFYLSDKYNIDLYDSLIKIMKLIPNCEKICEIIIKNLLKNLGFILSIEFKMWIYYGINMELYFNSYFDYFILYLIDCSLIKYMFSLDFNKKFFTIKNILEFCNVNDSHKDFNNEIFDNNENFLNADLSWCKDDKLNKQTKLNARIIEIILKILRNNINIFDLFGFSNSEVNSSNLTDNLLNKFLNQERNKIKQFCQEKYLYRFLYYKNLSNFNDANRVIFYYMEKFFSESGIQKIFTEITEKKQKINEQLLFSIKDEIINKCDLCYILTPKCSNDAEKYIISFKNDVINILNTNFHIELDVQKNLSLNCYKNFLLNEENCLFVFNFTDELIKNKNFEEIQLIFLNVMLRYISNIIYCSNIIKCENDVFSNKKIYDSILKLFKTLSNHGIIKDEYQIKLLDFIHSKISEKFNLNKNVSDFSNQKNLIKEKKEKLLEKMKKKFEMNNKKINEQYQNEINNLNEEEDFNYLNHELCVICRKPIIFEKFDSEPFGKFGFSEKEKFFDNCKKNIFIDSIKNYKKEKFYSDLYNYILNEKNNEIGARIVTCNHYIHFNCYDNSYIQILPEILRTKKVNLFCPLCKYCENCFIPCFSDLNSKLKNNFLKGFSNFNDLFTLYLKDKDEFKIPDENKKTFLNININDINPDIINGAKNFIEKHLYLESIDIFTVDNFDFLLINFNDFFDFYNICDDKNSQIEIMKNLIYSLRILLKSGKLKEVILLNLMKILFEYLNHFIKGNLDFGNENNFNEIIEKDKINYYLSNIIFIYLILFYDEEEESNLESFMSHIFYIFFIYNALLTFIKEYYINNDFQYNKISFEKFITYENIVRFFISKDNKNLDKTFDLFIEKLNCWMKLFDKNNKKTFNIDKSKFKNYLEIMTNKNNILNLNKENIFYNEKFNLNDFINIFIEKLIKSKQFNSTNENGSENNKEKQSLIKNKFIFKETLLINIKLYFHYIEIPEKMIDFVLKYQPGPCYYCNRRDKSSIICLICGKKICNSNQCEILKNGNYYKSYLEHSYECGGGNTSYVSTEHGDIFYVLNTEIKNANVYVYLNYVGDSQKNYKITDDFILKIDELKKSEKDFINLRFRKK